MDVRINQVEQPVKGFQDVVFLSCSVFVSKDLVNNLFRIQNPILCESTLFPLFPLLKITYIFLDSIDQKTGPVYKHNFEATFYKKHSVRLQSNPENIFWESRSVHFTISNLGVAYSWVVFTLMFSM